MKTNVAILIVFFVFITQTIVAQNFVPNHSFEDTTYSCPITIGISSNLDHCKDWYSPIGTSSDYYNSCSNSAAGVPNNMSGYQTPHSGEAYCGIIPNSIVPGWNWNEYLQVKLKTTLTIGSAYEFKMYLNLSDKSKFTTDAIGALFSNNPIMPIGPVIISQSPQLINTKNNFIIDRVQWVLFNQKFIADSLFQYLTIGNFFNNSNTTFFDTGINSGWVPSSSDVAYFLIDDVSLTPINTICFGDSISLQSQGDTLYAWAESSNPSVIISTDSVLTISPTVNTIYYDYSNNDTTEFIVNVMQNGTLNLGNDTNLCLGQSLLLNVATSNSTYLWQDNSTNYKYNVTQAGTYWVQVTNSCGFFTDTINITYNTIPVNLGSDTTLCIGQTLTLNPNIPNANYLWQNSSTSPTFIIQPWITQPSTYWVQISDSNACGADTININYNVFTNQNILDDYASLCVGDSLNLTASLLNSSYQWSTGSTDSIITVSETGVYWVQATNNCFVINDTINVNFKPIPYFELGDDITLCYGDTLILKINSLPNATTWWNFTFTSQITIEKEGQYIANAAYQGCYFKDTIRVTYEDCEISLIIPNVFTPNADGMNDFFSLEGLNINSISIKILNRWGQLVFESNDINVSWNGKTIKNKDCPSGTYFYIIKAENEQNSKIFKGTITLLK